MLISIKSQVASAKDAIARANAMNKQNVSGQNLAARQAIANQKTNLANQQQMHNKGLEQQNFQNELQKTGAQGQAAGNLANMYSGQAQSSAAADAAVTGGIMGLAGSLGGAYIGKKEDGGMVHAENGAMVTESMPIQDQAVEAEKKQRDAFKKKYMKQMHDEILGSKEEVTREPKRAEDGAMYASDGSGDIIDSGMESYADDRVDAKVNDGEAIINVPQQQRLMDLIRGKISVDELGTDDIIEGVPRESRDEMHKEIEEDASGSKEELGMKKLLEMLGGL